MTRDSKLWTCLRIISALLTAIAGFALASEHGAGSLGLSQVALNWILVINSALALSAGALGNSPLPGKNDDGKMRGGGAGFIGLIAVLALGSMLTACGDKKPVSLPANLPAASSTADEQLRIAVDRALVSLDASQDLLEEVVTAEKAVEPVMSPATKARARQILHQVNDAIVTAAVKIKRGVGSWSALRAAVDPALSQVHALVDFANTLSASESGGLRAKVSALFSWGQSLLKLVSGAPLPLALEGAQ